MRLLGLVLTPLALLANTNTNCKILEEDFEKQVQLAVTQRILYCGKLEISIEILRNMRIANCSMDDQDKELEILLPQLKRRFCD